MVRMMYTFDMIILWKPKPNAAHILYDRHVTNSETVIIKYFYVFLYLHYLLKQL